MSRNLLVILRTCTRVNMLNGEQLGGRHVKVPKHQLVNVCMSSLINSINQVKNHQIFVMVLDDHSSPEAVADFKQILSRCKFPTEFIPVEDGTGPSHTAKKVYELVENYATDLWYHIEDDYLHFPEAVQDMIDTVDQLEQNTGNMIAINPHDDVWRYTNQIYESLILFGPYRHYRTVKHSTYTCLASKQIYDKYRNHFQDAAEWILRKTEDETINQVWVKPDVMLFSPIPSLAQHIVIEELKDPYIDFDKLWDSTPHLWKPEDEMDFAIISMYNDAHNDLGAVAWPNKEKYAEKHGYGSYCKTDNFTDPVSIQFEKFIMMLELFEANPDLDWCWWLDNDAMITNYDIRLEDIVDNNYHIIITTDIATVNGGSFIVRNSQQGKDWLKFMLDIGHSEYKDNKWPDQQPMADFFIKYRDIIKVVPQRTMNSYDYKIYNVAGIDLLGESGQWHPGDFVIHFPALPNPTRIQLMNQYTKQLGL